MPNEQAEMTVLATGSALARSCCPKWEAVMRKLKINRTDFEPALASISDQTTAFLDA
jgi:hypothetical protein